MAEAIATSPAAPQPAATAKPLKKPVKKAEKKEQAPKASTTKDRTCKTSPKPPKRASHRSFKQPTVRLIEEYDPPPVMDTRSGFCCCFRRKSAGLCVFCNCPNFPGSGYRCGRCGSRYHFQCIINQFRLYGVCICGYPLELGELRQRMQKCVFCGRKLDDFEVPLACGHGCCEKCRWHAHGAVRCKECGVISTFYE